MTLVKKAQDTIGSYKTMGKDLKWMVHTNCRTHGSSCGGSLSQQVSSGVFILAESRVDDFCKNYFSYLDDEPRKILTASLKSLFDTEGFAWSQKYINISCGDSAIDKPITGGFFFMYVDEGDAGGKRKVFIGLAQLTKRPASSHSFLKDYYEGKEDRVEHALKYMLYRDVKSKGLIKK